MSASVFVDASHRIRSGWWVLLFFLSLALFVFPMILVARHFELEVSLWAQCVAILLASWVCQALRKRPLGELFGTLDRSWLRQLTAGLGLGAAAMAVPALALALGGWVHFELQPIQVTAMLGLCSVFIAGAIAEELLFRGFLFQRLTHGLGPFAAQLLISAYFVLTHASNPGMTGQTRIWAAVNIFVASLLFGLAQLKTRALALPIGLHAGANLTQGVLLGFGVSGEAHEGLLKPVLGGAPSWLTGASFGLEASLPGLLTVVVLTALMLAWKPSKTTLTS